MDRITMDILRNTFLKKDTQWRVSLFMPTHRAGKETEQDPIRYKNLLRKVEEGLLSKGVRSLEVQDLLKKPKQLLQNLRFWQRQSHGLAMFFSADFFHFFRLPAAFEEMVVITNRFHIKPLLPLLTSDGRFYILALSQHQARLLEATRHSVEEVRLEGVPLSLAEAFPDIVFEKQLQFHTGTPQAGAGKRAAMFYGYDVSTEIRHKMVSWFRMIDKKLPDFISEPGSPLVLAGVDHLFPIYKEANTYPHLMEEGVAGNPEGLRPESLHEPAWRVVEPLFHKTREAAIDRYRQLAGTGQTSSDLKEVVLAAHHGRIDTLFVAVGVQVWGEADPAKDEVHMRGSTESGDEDLLDLAAIQCIIKGGTVYAVSPEEVPDYKSLAAIFRY